MLGRAGVDRLSTRPAPAAAHHATAPVDEAAMPESIAYSPEAPTADALHALPGLVLLDFGTDWCGHCVGARAAVDAWVAAHPRINHLRIEDGRGRRLGRAFTVKLWPTLVLLRNGEEIARVVRPREARDLAPLEAALA